MHMAQLLLLEAVYTFVSHCAHRFGQCHQNILCCFVLLMNVYPQKKRRAPLPEGALTAPPLLSPPQLHQQAGCDAGR